MPAKANASDERLLESLKYLALYKDPQQDTTTSSQQINEIKLTGKARIRHHSSIRMLDGKRDAFQQNFN